MLSYFSQIVSKKAKITISFFMKNSKNNNIIHTFLNFQNLKLEFTLVSRQVRAKQRAFLKLPGIPSDR